MIYRLHLLDRNMAAYLLSLKSSKLWYTSLAGHDELNRFNAVARKHQQSGFLRKEKYKIWWWEYNLLPMDRVTDISVRR